MTAGPSVTVILPAHNAARFVARAVGSVLAQTHGTFELIVVDDGSSDDTAARVRAFADERVRLVSLAANVGVSAARNLALREARASIVAFMDADDECAPDRLATQLSFLRGHPDVDVVGSAILAIDEAGRPLGYRTYPCGHDAIVRRLPLASPVAMPTVVARREALVDAGGFDSRWDPVEDYDLWTSTILFSLAANLKIYPAMLLLLVIWRFRLRSVLPIVAVDVLLALIAGPGNLVGFFRNSSSMIENGASWVGNESAKSFSWWIDQVDPWYLPHVPTAVLLTVPAVVFVVTAVLLWRRSCCFLPSCWGPRVPGRQSLGGCCWRSLWRCSSSAGRRDS